MIPDEQPAVTVLALDDIRGDVFRGGLATGTVLLWIINFMNLLCAYFLANWLPGVMSGAGHSTALSPRCGSCSLSFARLPP